MAHALHSATGMSAAIDFDSTLIRRGFHAATFTEMAQFAEAVEMRPLDKLLAELPAVAQLSELKFSLARQVIRRRVRMLAPIDREQLRLFAAEVAEGAAVDVATRIRGIFA
jgi:hypothetical protein